MTAPDVAVTGRTLRWHQDEAVRYALDHRGPPAVPCRGTMFAHEPGAGKSTMALATLEAADAWPATIVAPAKLRPNWVREANATVPHRRVAVVLPRSTDMRLVRRLRAQGATPMLGRPRPGCDLYVTGYHPLLPELHAFEQLRLRGLVIDESQLCRSRDRVKVCARCWAPMSGAVCTGRPAHVPGRNGVVVSYAVTWTRALHRLAQHVPGGGMILELTATPNKNGTVGYLTQLALLNRLSDMGGEQRLVDRYCQPDPERAAAFQTVVAGVCVLRRRRDEYLDDTVTLDIQPKYLEVPDSPALTAYRRAEAEVVRYLAKEAHSAARAAGREPTADYVTAWIRAEAGRQFVRIGTLRKLIAAAKLPLVMEEIDEFLDGTDRKLVVFAHHHEITDALADRYRVRPLDGRTADPQPIVDAFQDDPATRVAVLGIMGGVGHTLTAASDMIFAEGAWCWGDYEQCFGRVYGRVNDAHSATARMLLADDSIDVDWWGMIEAKRAIAEAGIDGATTEDVRGDLLTRLALGDTDHLS